MYSGYVHLVDQKASGVDGGASVAGSWQTRVLTNELQDTENVCTLAANQFALDAGTYRCQISAPHFRSDSHQIRLYNITDAALEILGSSSWNDSSSSEGETRAFCEGRFTIAAQKTFEIQYRVDVARIINGLGILVTWGDNIYTIVELWKEQ